VTLDRVVFMAAFLILPLAVFVVFELWPYLQAVYVALTDWTGFTSEKDFVGLANFARMLHDPAFLQALGNSLTLVAVVPTVVIFLGFVIAFVVTAGGPSTGPIRGIRGAGVYRVLTFFPYCVPAIIIGLIWAQAFDPRHGLLNSALLGLGLPWFKNFAWLGQVSTAMPSAMFVIVWASVGLYTILFVAAIKGVPAETYEAAKIDGAGKLRIAVQVTLPQMLDNVRTGYIYIGLAAIDSFVFMQALFPRNSSPQHSATTLTQQLYIEAFQQGRFGYATAMGLVLALLTLAYAGLVFLVFRLIRGRDNWRET
jgi:N-acetylglucosamine transport system permease protein